MTTGPGQLLKLNGTEANTIVSDPIAKNVEVPYSLPADVVAWLRATFAECNDYVSGKLSNLPTTYETSLDMALIERLSSVPTPILTASGWTINISTHFLGGGRHFAEWPGERRWEVADIGVLVLFRQGHKLIRSKVALLQSKRLYADEIDWDEDNPLDYMLGFGRLLEDDTDWGAVVRPRPFTFTRESRYKALRKGDQQYRAIAGYENSRGVPVYYLLYNPLEIPSTRHLPAHAGEVDSHTNDVGCRVLPATALHRAIADLQEHATPRFLDLPPSAELLLLQGDDLPGWRLEEFIADLVVQCKAGYIAANRHDAGLEYVFNRRTGPISAAFQITIDAPEG